MWSLADRFQHESLINVFALFLAGGLIFLFFAAGCSDHRAGGQGAVDDDVSQNDDDLSDDDNISDDDIDDDTASDDDVKQAVPPNMSFLESIPVVDEPDLKIEMIAGGGPGYDGVSLVKMADGTFVLPAVKGRTLFVYRAQIGGVTTKEMIANFASSPTLSVGDDGTLHLAYLDMSSNTPNIMYANNSGGAWFTEIVAEYTGVDPYNVSPSFQLAADNSGAVHLAYLLTDVGLPDDRANVIYGTNADGSWKIEEVATSANYDKTGIALAVEQDQTVDLAFAKDDQLIYARKQAAEWSNTILDVNSSLTDVFFAFDHEGALHFLYGRAAEHGDGGEHVYMSRIGGVWNSEIVGFDKPYVSALGISIADDGVVYVLGRDNAIDFPMFELLLATRHSDGWNVAVFQPPSQKQETPGSAQLSSDDRGQPVIACTTGTTGNDFDPVAGSIVLAYRDEQNRWASQLVSLVAGARWNPALAIDADGEVRIAFALDDPSSYPRAWLARGAWGDWSDQLLGRGMGVALALDANQKSHVVAWDEQENKLYYHTDASGSWTSEAVDIPQPSDPNEVIKHWQNSIALDPDGSPAIATCGNSQWGLVGMGQLVYASRNSQWSARQLASFAATTFCRPALVFNGADPHIAYFHSFNYGYEQGFLTYWRLAGGKWQAEFVAGGAPGEQHGWGPDLAVDADGAEYIIYSEAAATMLATGSFHDWTRETIRDQGLELDYPMALTLNNGDLVVAIPYGDQWVDVTIGLRHNGVWTFKSFDHGLIYGAQGIDIAVAPDGWIHVVYTGDYAVWHAQISPEYLLRGGRTP